VVDDASSDDSVAQIHKAREDLGLLDAVSILPLPVNGGQTAASAAGLGVTRGAYVVFLDADDELEPPCIEAHVLAHLSCRIAAGFSAVDTINVVDGQPVTTTTKGFSTYVASGKGRNPAMFREFGTGQWQGWYAGRQPVVTMDDIHLALAPKADPWIWSPTSGNCYRRDAIARLLKGPWLNQIRFNTDAYLARTVAALHGSILIDKPLMRYRIHGGNSMVRNAPLDMSLNYVPALCLEHDRAALSTAIRTLFDELPNPAHTYQWPTMFWNAVSALSSVWPGLPRTPDGRTFLAVMVLEHEDALVAAFGHRYTGLFMLRTGAHIRKGLGHLVRAAAQRP
jgi:glycosyltransferase involved in cell wall biosynthesis